MKSLIYLLVFLILLNFLYAKNVKIIFLNKSSSSLSAKSDETNLNNEESNMKFPEDNKMKNNENYVILSNPHTFVLKNETDTTNNIIIMDQTEISIPIQKQEKTHQDKPSNLKQADSGKILHGIDDVYELALHGKFKQIIV